MVFLQLGPCARVKGTRVLQACNPGLAGTMDTEQGPRFSLAELQMAAHGDAPQEPPDLPVPSSPWAQSWRPAVSCIRAALFGEP